MVSKKRKHCLITHNLSPLFVSLSHSVSFCLYLLFLFHNSPSFLSHTHISPSYFSPHSLCISLLYLPPLLSLSPSSLSILTLYVSTSSPSTPCLSLLYVSPSSLFPSLCLPRLSPSLCVLISISLIPLSPLSLLFLSLLFSICFPPLSFLSLK